jgi:hypothetical protein
MTFVVCTLLAAARADAQFAVANPVPGEQYVVELGLNWWTPAPVLEIQTGALAAIGENRVDFVEEFAIENTRFTEFRATVKAGRKHKLRFSRVPMRYEESATLTRTLDFGGVTFPVSVPATADLEWLLWRVGYEWDFAFGRPRLRRAGHRAQGESGDRRAGGGGTGQRAHRDHGARADDRTRGPRIPRAPRVDHGRVHRLQRPGLRRQLGERRGGR